MVTYSDSFIEFLKKKKDSSKAAELLYEDYTRLYYDGQSALHTTTDQLNYITFRTDGTISFLPTGKEHKINPDTNEWLRDGRQNGKPAKVIRKLFTKDALTLLSDSDFEIFSNSYKANYSNDGFVFSLLPANDIPKIYDMERCSEGTLGDSCMNGDIEYLEMYANCKSLQILTLQKDGVLHGRALIWNIDNEIILMDRIYVSKDFLYENFLEYAKENKMWRKKHYKTYDSKQDFINVEGAEIRKQFTIITDTSFDYYPYIDTFSFGDDGSLNNFNSGEYTYNCTDGSREGDDVDDDNEGQEYDDINGEYIDSYDAVYLEYGDRQYRNRTTNINNCVQVDDNWYHEDDSTIVEVSGDYYTKDSDDIMIVDNEYVLSSDCVYSKRDDEYYLSDDCVEDKDGEYILKSEAVMVNNEWIHEDDVEDFSDAEMLGANQIVYNNPNQIKMFA